MHFEQSYYVSIIKRHFPQSFVEAAVLEVGSYDVNGSIREFFDHCEYIGLDLMPGPGVDVVSSGHEYNTYKRFDTVMSCECFEHNPYYFETFENMVSTTCGGGLVVFTCATEGRPEHGTTRTSPESSPGTVSTGWEYYKNLTEKDFSAFQFRKNFAGYRFMANPGSQDLYFVGVKYPAPDDVDERLTRIVEEVDELITASVQCVASDTLFLAGDPSGAADGLGRIALSLHQDLEAYVRYKQAWFLMSAKRYPEAGVVIQRLLLLGDRPEYHFQHSQFLHETGKAEAAKEAAHAAIKRDPSHAEYWEHVANLLLNSGDRKGAESAMMEAVRLSPLDVGRNNRIRSLGFQQRSVGSGAIARGPLTYEVSFSSLSASGFDRKIRLWNLESPVAGRHEAAGDGVVSISGWVLPQDAQDEISLLIGVGAVVDAYGVNIERPDVVAAILQESPEESRRLQCGFQCTISVKAGFFRIGFRIGTVDVWVREMRVICRPHLLTGTNSWEFPADAVNGVLELHGKPPIVERTAVRAWQQRIAGTRTEVPAPYIVLVAPHKAAVYPNLLPADTALFFQRIVYRIVDHDSSVLYPLERFVSSGLRRPTYPQSGALWTPYGAYVAYRALMEKLGYVLPRVRVVEEARVVWGAEGVEPVFERHAEVVCQNGLGGTGAMKYYRNSERTLPKAMLLCDAWGLTSFDSFLAESCAELLCVCVSELDTEAIGRYAPDFVVSLYSEETLARPPQENISFYQVIKSGINSGAYSAVMLEQFVSQTKDVSGILSAEELADLTRDAQAALV
jgi:tetratricopeptide (TPR) repeat protein